MATEISRKRDLVSTESLAFMRPITIKFEAKDCKPKARMYALFDDVGVNEFIVPLNGPDAGIMGGRIIADDIGNISGEFHVPGMSFNTGTKTFMLTENPKYNEPEINGSLFGYAVADFSSTGIKEIYQTTIEMLEVVNVYVPWTPPRIDPLAQSFFTHGVTGGCFVTSIDLYFQSKDEEVPVIVEIREMVNGYPGPMLASPYARVSLPPSQINISDDSTLATNFKFATPFYLEEDKDYCFVVLANTKNYFMFTCTMGERAFENDRIVFEQPYLGSLFKSQNNDTWTAEQYEDIKFTLYKAEFQTGSAANVNLVSNSPPVITDTSVLSTTMNSNVVRCELTFDHNLEVGNKVYVSVDQRGKYNGIPANRLTGTFNCVSVLSRRAFEFAIGVNATVSGVVQHGGIVTHCIIDNKGTGYTYDDPPVLTFSDAPVGGITASGKAIIEFGQIIGIEMTNVGSGYINTPTITIVSSTGLGASARASLTTTAMVNVNRGYSMITPGITNFMAGGTDIQATYSWTKANYENGNVTQYTPGDSVKFNLMQKNWLTQPALLVSHDNEVSIMSGQKSSMVNLFMSSTNKNVSPFISTKNAVMMFSGNLINNQINEDIISINSSGELNSIEVVTGGAGYSNVPTITFVNQYGDPGSGAQASAQLSGGTIVNITIDNPGSGYLKPPFVVITGAATVAATAKAYLTDFNSELQANSGTARARYITKINYLTGSTDSARAFVEAYSGLNSNFEVYIRTSLKAEGKVHTDQEWTLMKCDTERNKSSYDGQVFEYEFYLDSMKKFDTYDFKIVLRSTDIVDVPWLKNLRAVLTV